MFVLSKVDLSNMKCQCNIGQGFGGNATATYKAGGLLGHPAIDNSCGYGTLINSYWDQEYVYKVLTVENPANDGSGFTGVFTIVEQDGKVFEFLYGHCNPSVVVGSILTKGSVVGTEANNGEVYSGQERITLAMQKAGDHRGTHRHDQARELRKDKTIQGDTTYITGMNGSIYSKDGFYYAVPNHKNGYNGCYDWTKTVDDSKLKAAKFALRDWQVSVGLMDFANETDYKKIKFGPKSQALFNK